MGRHPRPCAERTGPRHGLRPRDKLPGYRARVGLALPEAALLQEKRKAMVSLEAYLAADTQRREEAEKAVAAEAKATLKNQVVVVEAA
ncbi:hypothetical protein [Gluconobacter cerinus]|uniref:hypothetical protein n=1 Tax=Gluconobacter cerinus TaxID=38307 RepID=UPI001B8B0CB2|nr:hypothetical protein [Gluconobacter cerinus]MBS1026013.1 hypothetical protein [Gluconobacter cerinus]MBS1035697.1 hypothetical protein [Gluconobacter cerinus]MBS1045640.1 hypothetical protein [Gluconobacter cerinus]MBS1072770.1 hypothetical protein [Gluconobacter cerinus]